MKYDLSQLKEICEKRISCELTADNACHNLVLADLYSCSLLKAEVLDFIRRKGKKIVCSDGYKQLSSDPTRFSLLNEIILELVKGR